MTAPKPVRVALYTRVSTDLQATQEEGSLDTQEARLRAQVTARGEEYRVVRVFREEGASGKSLDRPEVQALLKAIRRGELDLVMVTRVDRLSRSLTDFFKVYELMEKHGVEFSSLKEHFDTSSAIGRAMLKLMLVFAELEREQTAERTRTAMRARAERGLWGGGPPPLGYDPQGNGHLQINEEEAPIARLIFDKYIELRSGTKVAKWLNDQGYRQKRYESRRRGKVGGRRFTADVVRFHLRNPVFIGKVSSHGDLFDGQHEPLVDEATFERANALLNGNRRRSRTTVRKDATHTFPLAGLVRCSCGYAMTPASGGGRTKRYHYYECVGLNGRPDHVCGVRRVRAQELEETVMELTRKLVSDPTIIEATLTKARATAAEASAPVEEQLIHLRRELAKVQEDGERMAVGFLERDLLDSTFAKAALGKLEARQEELTRAVLDAEARLAQSSVKSLDLQYAAERLRELLAVMNELEPAELREMLRMLILQVVVHEDHLVVDFLDGTEDTPA